MDNKWKDMKERYYEVIEQQFGPTKEVNLILSKLVEKRIELNMTQNDLAKKTGLKQPAIARIENFTVLPRLDTLLKIFRVLDLKLAVIDKGNEDIYEYMIENIWIDKLNTKINDDIKMYKNIKRKTDITIWPEGRDKACKNRVYKNLSVV